MEDLREETYNQIIHEYLMQELIKEVHTRNKLLDTNYQECMKEEENQLQEIRSWLNDEQTKKFEEYINTVSTNHRVLCREMYLQGMRDCADIFFHK